MSDVAAPDTGVPGVSSFDSVIKQYAKSMGDTDAVQDELKESRALQRGIAKKLITDQPPPPPDTAAPTPPPPPTQQKSPMEAFGSMASVIGILGGFLSHAPLTASLKAATGAMDGYRQRDLETYNQNYKQWQVQSEYAEKLAAWQNDRYKQAFEAHKDNQDQLMAALQAISAADKDTLAAKTLQTGDLMNWATLQKMREDSLLKFKEYRLEADRMGAMRGAELTAMDEMKKSPEWITAPAERKVKMLEDLHQQFQKQGSPQSVAVQRFLELNPNAKPEDIAKFIASMRNSSIQVSPEELKSLGAQASSGMPLTQIVPGYRQDATELRQKVRQEAINQIKATNPGMSDEDAGMDLANRTIEFSAGKRSEGQLITMLGATHQAVNQLDFNVNKVKEEMDKLGSSDLSPVINAIARGEERWTGEPAYSSLFFFMHAAAVESARILSGGQASVAQLHQGAMDEAKQWANINMTPASWDAVADAMREEGAYRLQTYQDAIKYQRRGAVQTPPVAPQPAAALKAKPGVKYQHKGRPIEVKDGKWIYSDGAREEVKD